MLWGSNASYNRLPDAAVHRPKAMVQGLALPTLSGVVWGGVMCGVVWGGVVCGVVWGEVRRPDV